MTNAYSVIEIQVDSEGNVAFTPIATFTNRNEAESRFHYVLSFAATSTLAKHAVMLISEDGRLLERKCYEHITEVEDENTGNEYIG